MPSGTIAHHTAGTSDSTTLAETMMFIRRGWPTHGDEDRLSARCSLADDRRPTANFRCREPPTPGVHSSPPGSATPKIAIRLASERPIVSFQVRLATHIWHRSVEICNTLWSIIAVVGGDETSGRVQGFWAGTVITPGKSAQGIRGGLAGERPRNEFARLRDAVEGDEGAEPGAALFAQ